MKKIIIFVFSALVVFTSCKKYLDVNTDPNNPKKAPYKTVLPAAMMTTCMNYGGYATITGSFWAQHFTQNNTTNTFNGIDSYNVTGSTFAQSSIYGGEFINGLKNYNFVIKEAAAANDWSVHLAATCMLAFSTQLLVDLWDRLPYFEALSTTNLTPRWDNGNEIYADLIRRLDDALDKNFTLSTNSNLGSADYVFNGNVANWQKFANTLKLKLYLRQTKVNPTAAKAGITECLNSPIGFVTDAKITIFSDVAGKHNPFYGICVTTGNGALGNVHHRASNTMLNFLKAGNDPRLDKFYVAGSESGGTIYGLDQGNYTISQAESPNNKLAQGRWGAVDPVYFFSNPQIRFMLAEAKEHLGQDGKADYDAGVLAAFQMHGLDGSSFIAASGAYEYPATDKIKAIITQKWAASCLTNLCIEAWFDHSRTGYPDFFTVSKTSVLSNGSAFPKRFIYPTGEVSTNPNTPAIEPVDSPVWWAK